MCQRLAALGAHYALVITPSFYKSAMTSRALRTYYEHVADASPIPVLLYNVPGNTQVELDADTCIALARHENIVGLKDSGGDVSSRHR